MISKRGEQICEWKEIKASPSLEGYRNKISLTAGLDPQGNRCFGFAIGRVEHGVSAIHVGSNLTVAHLRIPPTARTCQNML